MIESINVEIVEGKLTSSREDPEESDDEEEKGSKKRGVKKIKVEEQLDENEEQLTEDEELNQPTFEQEEKKDHLSPKNWCQKNHLSNQIIGDKDARIGTRRR